MSPGEREDPVPIALREVLEGSTAPAALLRLCQLRAAQTESKITVLFSSLSGQGSGSQIDFSSDTRPTLCQAHV